MRFLTEIESARKVHNIPGACDLGQELRADFSALLDRSAALARLVMSVIGPEQQIFLWIREFGVWPSLENPDLFSALRAASGENRPLHEAPGHQFASDEFERSVSYVQLMLLNGWGGVLIGQQNRNRIAISHDSWLSIRSSAAAASLHARLDDFGLPRRTEEAPRSLVEVPPLSASKTNPASIP